MREEESRLFMKKVSEPFDVEGVLTRAVYRVLNHNPRDSDKHNNVEKAQKSSSLPNVQGQMRLIAEQLCKRVEKRYEKRLSEQREKDNLTTERRLQSIRREYREDLEHQKSKLERDKTMLEELFREKERTMQHSLELRFLDRENNLEVQRKLLENRFNELRCLKDQLEKASSDFKRKMKADLESVRIEWNKLSLKQDELNNEKNDGCNCKQTAMDNAMSSRMAEVERLDRKLRNASEENESLRAKCTQAESQIDSLRMEVRRLFLEKDELLEKNRRLAVDFESVKDIRSISRVEWNRREVEAKLNEEAHLQKINEMKLVICMLNGKLKSVSSERNYLRDELRLMKKEALQSRNRTDFDSQQRREYRRVRSITRCSSSARDSSESTSGSIPSNGTHEINEIKRRIRNLDDLAKELDLSVDHFTSVRPAQRHHLMSPFQQEEEETGYDDFCRSLIDKNSKHSSPIKGPPKVVESGPREERERIGFMDVPLQRSTANPDSSNAIQYQNERLPVTDTLPKADEPVKVEEQAPAELIIEEPQPAEEQPVASVANPLFEGVDPVMEKYMKMVMESRKDKDSGTQAASSRAQEAPNQQPETVEIVESEEMRLDPVNYSDGEIDW